MSMKHGNIQKIGSSTFLNINKEINTKIVYKNDSKMYDVTKISVSNKRCSFKLPNLKIIQMFFKSLFTQNYYCFQDW